MDRVLIFYWLMTLLTDEINDKKDILTPSLGFNFPK
jgi:hypothetical protein